MGGKGQDSRAEAPVVAAVGREGRHRGAEPYRADYVYHH